MLQVAPQRADALDELPLSVWCSFRRAISTKGKDCVSVPLESPLGLCSDLS